MSKQPPPAPTANAIDPCPTIIQISRTPRHWKFTQHLRTTRPPQIQWNCRDLKANYEETLLLLKDYEPAALCLQETHLKDSDNVSIKTYTAFHSFSANNERAAGGISVFVHNNAPHSHIPLTPCWSRERIGQTYPSAGRKRLSKRGGSFAVNSVGWLVVLGLTAL